ncbi:MAG: hypothetical protein K9M13_01390, partial [Simkaniaceae bacterium]|nr:hypothetical protein [Simkaniaceae bacterium]
ITLVLYLLSWGLAIWMKIDTNGFFGIQLMKAIFLISVGMSGLVKCLGNLLFSEKTARYVHWTHTPYQHEVGVAHLSFAVLGTLSFFYSTYWYATAIGVIIFYLGNALVHITDMKRHGNFSIGNAGIVFYLDLVVPFTLAIGLILHVYGI